MQEKIYRAGKHYKKWTNFELAKKNVSKETVTTIRNDGANSKIKIGDKTVCS